MSAGGALALLAGGLIAVGPGAPGGRLAAGGAGAGETTRRRGGPAVYIGAASAGILAMLLLGSPLTISAAAIVGAMAVHLTRDIARGRAERRRDEVAADRLGHLAAGLRAGLPRERAAATIGGPIDTLPGLPALWRAAERHGIALAPLVEQLQARVDARIRHRAATAASLTGPQSTAIVLSLLPLAGLGLGAGLGAHPGEFLFGTTWGGVALNAGLGLIAAGLAWSRAIMNSVGRPA